MRRLVKWYGTPHPVVQGLIVTTVLLVAWLVGSYITGFPFEHLPAGGWIGGVLALVIGGFAGLVCGEIGRFVRAVAQAKRDLEADSVAMHDAIERLERGDR